MGDNGNSMNKQKKFTPLSRPFEIEDNLDRMRYLIDCLVWKDEIFQAYVHDRWLIASNDQGKTVVPFWPTVDCAIRTLGRQDGVEIVKLTQSEFIESVLPLFDDDELIAAFPNDNLNYEMLTASEMRKAVRYSYLNMKSVLNELSEGEEEEFFRFRKLNLKANLK